MQPRAFQNMVFDQRMNGGKDHAHMPIRLVKADRLGSPMWNRMGGYGWLDNLLAGAVGEPPYLKTF